MTRYVLLSVQPQWLAKILNGEKKIEIRKAIPNLTPPYDVLLYCTKARKSSVFTKEEHFALSHDWWEHSDKTEKEPQFDDFKTTFYKNGNDILWSGAHKNYIVNGKIVGKVTVDKVDTIITSREYNNALGPAAMTFAQMFNYAQGKPLHALHLTNLVIFDKPMELGEVYRELLKHELATESTVLYNHSFYTIPLNRLTKAPQNFCYVYAEEGERK